MGVADCEVQYMYIRSIVRGAHRQLNDLNWGTFYMPVWAYVIVYNSSRITCSIHVHVVA